MRIEQGELEETLQRYLSPCQLLKNDGKNFLVGDKIVYPTPCLDGLFALRFPNYGKPIILPNVIEVAEELIAKNRADAFQIGMYNPHNRPVVVPIKLYWLTE